MWNLQTGITLAKPPCSFQEHDCAIRALGTSAVSSIPLQSPGDLDKLALHREGERLILLKTSWDKHSSKLPWDAAVEKVGGGRIERNEKEILKNLSSFYPLDQEMSGCIFISCSCCSFSLQCLQWSPDLEGLWLWVLWGKGWGKNCSTAACPAGLVCPLPGCSSPVQSVWKRLFLFFTFQNFWPTHSYPTLVCPFMFPCFIFIFRRIICLEIAGVPEALNHLFSPPQAFLSQKSFPFHPLLTSQKIFSGNYLPDTAIPLLPHWKRYFPTTHTCCFAVSLAAKGAFSSCLPQSGLTYSCLEIAGPEIGKRAAMLMRKQIVIMDQNLLIKDISNKMHMV